MMIQVEDFSKTFVLLYQTETLEYLEHNIQGVLTIQVHISLKYSYLSTRLGHASSWSIIYRVFRRCRSKIPPKMYQTLRCYIPELVGLKRMFNDVNPNITVIKFSFYPLIIFSISNPCYRNLYVDGMIILKCILGLKSAESNDNVTGLY